MNKQRTKIHWTLHDHCTARCTYCPTRFWRGDTPRHINEYLNITNNIISHYKSMGREIDWTFDGGEPLDMIDFPMMLKLCHEKGGDITVNSNGGKLWLDWWAIEPRITTLNLTYHYWQNPHLIKFILDTFHKNNKNVKVTVPVRPDHFEEDMQRIADTESMHNIIVNIGILYNEADDMIGMFPYTDQQLTIMYGEDVNTEHAYYKSSTFKERFEKKLASNPSFTGMQCNAGIDALRISYDGWATGSACNNRPLGNIWNPSFQLPSDPHKCGMMACMTASDQQIIKFYPT
jgi:MoaA/NifB/PqqE/SkfB family radical SAM enzyme